MRKTIQAHLQCSIGVRFNLVCDKNQFLKGAFFITRKGIFEEFSFVFHVGTGSMRVLIS